MNLSLSRCFSWDQERKKLGEKNKIRGKNESSKVIWAASTLSGNSIKQIQEMAKENTVMTKKKKVQCTPNYCQNWHDYCISLVLRFSGG